MNSIEQLNKIVESRDKMIATIANHIGKQRGYTTDKQFDRLEAKYSKKSFAALKNITIAIYSNVNCN